MSKRIDVKNLDIYYGDFLAVKDVSVTIEPRSVTALIGPSGCGKSTFLRSLNRMHEVIPGASVKGEILLDGNDIYGKNIDPVSVRNTVGMVFQKANPFPTMSIEDNVVAGLKLAGEKDKKKLKEVAEQSLRGADSGRRREVAQRQQHRGAPRTERIARHGLQRDERRETTEPEREHRQ